MDGTHDLGGRQGFGKVDADEPEEAFHSDWEARMFAMAFLITAPGWTIDLWRHSRELIDPADYLLRPYFDQWMQTVAALLVDSGVVSVEELSAGRSLTGDTAFLSPVSEVQAAAFVRGTHSGFARRSNQRPLYRVGQGVRAKAMGTPGHTRLPGYARGRAGRIAQLRGHHVLPDESARGREVAEPLYTVAFAAAELWPEAMHSKDEILIDLWESYLEPL
jgi:nitrile hydratase subunit beta